MAENFSLEQLSDYLKISKSTIYKKTSTRSIPFIKIGKKLLFRREAIDQWVDAHKQPMAEEIETDALNLLKQRHNG